MSCKKNALRECLKSYAVSTSHVPTIAVTRERSERPLTGPIFLRCRSSEHNLSNCWIFIISRPGIFCTTNPTLIPLNLFSNDFTEPWRRHRTTIRYQISVLTTRHQIWPVGSWKSTKTMSNAYLAHTGRFCHRAPGWEKHCFKTTPWKTHCLYEPCP